MILYQAVLVKDNSTLNRVKNWEKWFLSSGNGGMKEEKSYSDLIAETRKHPLTWGNLPPIEVEATDRALNLWEK